jgi:hypothetical protein
MPPGLAKLLINPAATMSSTMAMIGIVLSLVCGAVLLCGAVFRPFAIRLFQLLRLIIPAVGVPADIIKLSPKVITGRANESLDLRFEPCCLRGVGHMLFSRVH